MARYLSQAWFDEVNEAARKSTALRDGTAGMQLTLQQVVTGTPEGDLRYWVRIDDGTVETGLGTAADDGPPHATVTQSYETAEAVINGGLSAEEAFLGGRIRLRGDIGVLLRHQSVLNSLGDAFDDVRRGTEYR